MAKKAKEEMLLDLPVSFQGTSCGKKTARVGISIARGEIKITEADKTFCDRRLTVTIFADGKDDQRGQGRLAGMEDNLELVGVADVKSFSVHSETFTLGLTFNRIEMEKVKAATGVSFADFASREGRLMIASVAEIPEAEKNGEEDEGGDEE
jgi:hypothetical protein